MTVEIQKGIAMPMRGAGRNLVYPWNTMEVGDSFVYGAKASGNGITWAALRFAPKKFSGRTMTEDGKKVFRIWRTA